jgi:hypothetical protein
MPCHQKLRLRQVHCAGYLAHSASDYSDGDASCFSNMSRSFPVWRSFEEMRHDRLVRVLYRLIIVASDLNAGKTGGDEATFQGVCIDGSFPGVVLEACIADCGTNPLLYAETFDPEIGLS